MAKTPAKSASRTVVRGPKTAHDGTIAKPDKKPKTARRARRAKGAAAPVGGLRVRMYRLQLGDCFLLSFPKAHGGAFHALIDCGLIAGAADPSDVLTKVARDVGAAVGPGGLDLVVITHEHWDHVAGFKYARDVFETIPFKQLWLAWTEDPKDALAKKLRKDRDDRGVKVGKAVDAIKKRRGAAADHPMVAMAESLLDFSGGGKTREALDWAREHAEDVRYCRPGELLPLPGVPGVRIYVLGPPHDEDMIRRSMPHSGAGRETYLDVAAGAFLQAVDGSGAGPGGPNSPFDAEYAVEDPEHDPFFRDHYDAEADAWRRVDGDWAGLLGPLALQLDSDTNNTSLALAFELEPDGRVLLFPGDAQVGNWLSWHDIKVWKDAGETIETEVTSVDELLARTVLYKVGHHGSHNATLRAEGLEKMAVGKEDELLALVPVVEKFADTVKHWKMPWPDLAKRLNAKAGRGVLKADAKGRPPEGVVYGELTIDVPFPLGD